MAAIITEKFRLHNAKEFKQSATETGNAMYMFIGRPLSWSDDSNPPTPVDSLNDEYDAYANMTALKKVSSTDVSHAIIRRDWTSGTKYDEYRHNYTSSNTATSGATTLWASTFYVVTSDYNVYKVISNNGGANSTVMPTGTSTSIITTADGYKWKFMYSISASDVIKFVTSDFVPVKTIGAKAAVDGDVGGLGTAASDDNSAQWDVENGATDGTIEHARVTTGGSSYGSDGNYNVAISGDGSSGQLQVTVSSNAITAVTVNAVGSGYSVASIDNTLLQTATSSSGTGAVFDIIISPKNGHGADPVEELGGNYIIINSRFEFGEGDGDFPTDNDFRRIGLVQDPFKNGTTTIGSDSSMTAYSQMTLSSASGLSPDDIIMDASTDGVGVAVSRIVSINGTVISHIPVANSEGGYANFAQADVVYKGGSNIGTVSSVNAAHPEVEHYSGNIMYIENRGAVSRAADQIEDIKLIIEM